MNFLSNGLIAQLAPLDQQLLLRQAPIIRFKAGDVLGVPKLDAPHIYFLTRGSVALFVGNQPKDMHTGLAVGLVGAEGALGLQLALGLGVSSLLFVAQSPGTAYAVNATLAQRLVRRKASVLMAFARYLWTEYESLANLAALSHTQDVRMRLAHWLLLSAQRCAPDALVITHAHIARMLGVRRASISLAARDMKVAGLIDYSRGHIELKKLDVLQRLAHG